MIKRTIILFISFFLIYECVVRFFPIKESVSQNVRQGNLIKAQDFIYENQNKRMIIAGSSLSGRIILKSTGFDLYDLSFSGLGPAEGINILVKTKSRPSIIFVETNFIDRRLGNKFSENIFNPAMHLVLSHIHSLRIKNKPVNYLFALKFFSLFRHDFSNFINNFFIRSGHIGSKFTAMGSGNNKESAYDKAVKKAIDRFQYIPDENRLNKFLESIKTNLDQLAKNGTKIVFFEMPMHPEVSDSPYANIMRQSVHKVFSEREYVFFNTPDPHDFQTTDGYHLDQLSAEKYTLFFTAELTKSKIN